MNVPLSSIANAVALMVNPAPAQEAAAPVEAAAPQESGESADVESRLEALEQKNAELENQIAALAGDVEQFEMRDIMPRVGESQYGLGPAASKVYTVDQGLSLGGYGEFLLTSPSGETDVADALRVVNYIGYKFSDKWIFNSEIEIEHGTTSASSGTTSSSGSVSVEFAYLDYLHADAVNARAGVVLIPVGFINELHEPTTFLPAARPVTETRIIPTTWRENGAGLFGNVAGFDYRVYITNGLNGSEFDASGFRGGRQKASRAAANDAAVSARLDWVDTPGLIVGSSVYYGESDQDSGALPDMSTTIVEAHADWKYGGWDLRVLAAYSHLSNAGAFNDITGENVAEGMVGGYVEAGYDVLSALAPDSQQSLSPYVRWESINTQESLPDGFVASGGVDDEIVTYGLNYKPFDQVVVKADYQDWQDGTDRFQLLVGYVF